MKKLLLIILSLALLSTASSAHAQVFKLNQIIPIPVQTGLMYSNGIGTSTTSATSSPTVGYITATSTTATSTLPNLVATNFQLGEAVVLHKDGTRTAYKATTTTDYSRGVALQSAVAGANDGETVFFTGTSSMTTKLDMSKGGTATVSLVGSGQSTATILASTTDYGVRIGGNGGRYSDFTVTDTTIQNNFMISLGRSGVTTNTLIQNVTINGRSDALIISSGTNCNCNVARIINVKASSLWDVFLLSGGYFQIYNTDLTTDDTFNNQLGNDGKDIGLTGAGTVDVYNTIAHHTRGGSNGAAFYVIGGFGSDAFLNLHGAIADVTASSSLPADLKQVSAGGVGLLTVDAATVYNRSNTIGTISSQNSTIQNASTTILSATTACLGTDCRTVWPTSGSGAAFDWSQSANTYGVNSLTPSTTIPINIKSTSSSTFAGGLESFKMVLAPVVNATSTTATSTFAGPFKAMGGNYTMQTLAGGTSSHFTMRNNSTFCKNEFLEPNGDWETYVYLCSTGLPGSPLGEYIINHDGSINIGDVAVGNSLQLGATVTSLQNIDGLGFSIDNTDHTILNGAQVLLEDNSGSQIRLTNDNNILLSPNGNLGVATTSPASLLSVGSVNGLNFRTSTSTFSSTGGLDMANGCYAIRGVCQQAPITLTTTGSSGAATLINNVINIPQYTGGSGSSSVGARNILQASDGSGGFIATGTPQLTVGNLNATSTTATSQFSGKANFGPVGTSAFGTDKVNINDIDGLNSDVTSMVSGSAGGYPSIHLVSSAGTLTAPANTFPGISGNAPIGVYDFGFYSAGSWKIGGAMTSDSNGLNLYSSNTGISYPPNVFAPVPALTVSSSTQNVGIGTTSPYAALSVVGATGVVADHYTATSSARISVFTGGFTSFASSTVGNGSAGGGLTINGTGSTTKDFIVGNLLTVGSGVINMTGGEFLTSSSGNFDLTTFNSVRVTAIRGTNYSLQDVSGNPMIKLDTTNTRIGIGATTTPAATLSVQSNVSTGILFYVATSTTGGVGGYDNDGHRFTSGYSPVISSCGTGSPTVVGDDQGGTITTGTAATSCTLTFAKAYTVKPYVAGVADDSGTITPSITSISTTAVTFGLGAGLTGGNIHYSIAYHR